MELLPYILFALGFIGTMNAFALGCYCLFTKVYSQPSTRYFGLFLIVLTLRVLKSLLYAYATGVPILILQVGPAFFLLIGPLMLNYILSIKSPESSIVFQHKRIHLGIWVMVVIGIMVFLPFPKHVTFIKGVLLNLINLQWLFYILIALKITIPPILNYKASSLHDRWLAVFSIGILTIWSACYFIHFDFFYIPSIMYTLIFYSGFLYFVMNKKIRTKLFKAIKKTNKSNQQDIECIKKIQDLMDTKLLFKDSNLKLQDIANTIGISQHELSRIINENLDVNFNEFLNQYRIEEAKLLLLEEHQYTIEGISNEVGFKSKSAFYKSFKKFVGATPTQYKARKFSS